MHKTEKEFPKIGEKYVRADLDNGLTCFIIPKSVSTSYAALAVDFGSRDTHTSDGDVFMTGLAHFLEHKMFETKEGDALAKYASYGGNGNAYTASDMTVYNFSCAEHFYENLSILLDHVMNAHYTKRSVDKEKGIISQEIMMYADNPNRRCHLLLLESLYGECSISADPCGTVTDIQTVTPQMLNACRSKAYALSNMALCVWGDVDADKVLQIVTQSLPERPNGKKICFQSFGRSETILRRVYSETGDVASPLFNIGIRLDLDGVFMDVKTFAAIEIIMNVLFGKSSKLYSELYEAGLFEMLSDNCQTNRESSYALIGGISRDPEALYGKICEKLEEFASSGIDERDFERTKKAIYADLLFSFENSNTADLAISFFFDGDDLFEYPSVIASVDKPFAESLLKKLFVPKNTCLIYIKPKEETP